MRTHMTALMLTPRDQNILTTVYLYRGCAVTHLHLKYWPLGSALSTCYRRIQMLVSAGYLSASRLPSRTGVGSGKAFLSIGPAARPWIADVLGVPVRRIPKTPRPGVIGLFPAHHLAICDVRAALEVACARCPDVVVEEFAPEVVLRRHPLVVTDTAAVDGSTLQRRIVVIPDGAFTLRFQGQSQRTLLEIDMATESSPRIQAKLRGYMRRTGQAATVPVCFVTTTTSRLEQLCRLVEHEAATCGASPSLFFLTTLDQITAETVLHASIWRQGGNAHSVAILPESVHRAQGTRSNAAPAR